ncbi:DUF1015 domain-containing protein [bacterium]|nr:DUF1015 domain-containing protein [bacterium]
MVEVRPLDAIVYNQAKVNMADVIAPPYDVISDDYREKLSSKSDFNFVNLILPLEKDGLNKYEAANETFQKWLREKVLIKLEKPTILYLVQEYNLNGKKITRKGFIARVRIEDFSTKQILPHEYTMGGPKEDRLKLTKECKANFSQIFMVYSDKTRKIEGAVDLTQKPFIDVTDDFGVRNVVYLIDDEKTLNLISETLKHKTLLIADGHHRYETAMNYRNFINSPNPEDATKFVMSYFTNLEDDLLIYPTHRIITKKIDIEKAFKSIEKYFDIQEYPFNNIDKDEVKRFLLDKIEQEAKKKIAFGLYVKGRKVFYLLTLREDVTAILEKYEVPKVLRNLDLIILHKVLISEEFGYTQEEQASQNGILYIKQEKEAFDMIDKGEAEMSFIMAYPKIEDIHAVSLAGERMPQKSTYFYPKLLSGLVISPLSEI